MIYRQVFLIAFSFLITFSLSAGEYRRFGQSHRSLAMGNTGIASANDSAALFFNPAVLANVHTWWVDYTGILLEYSEDALVLVDDYRTGGISLDTQADIQAFLDKYIGTHPYIRLNAAFNAVGNLTPGGFTLAYNYQGELVVDLLTRNKVSPTVFVFEQLDTVQQVGGSIPLGNGKIILGIAYRNLSRQSLEFEYGLNEILTSADFPTLAGDGNSGSAGAYDVGFLLRMGSASFPVSIGIVGQNIGGIDLGDAGKEPVEYGAGIMLSPRIGLLRWIITMDYRDITYEQGDDDDFSQSRRIHLGTELGLGAFDYGRSFISLRAGLNQSYFTFGAEIAFKAALTAGFAVYSQETGEYAGQSENKRKVFYVSFGF